MLDVNSYAIEMTKCILEDKIIRIFDGKGV